MRGVVTTLSWVRLLLLHENLLEEDGRSGELKVDKRSYEYNYKIPNHELPRFVPPISVKFVESDSEIGIYCGHIQQVLDIEVEEVSGAYMLVGICEDMDMDMNMTEVEETEERKGIGEGVKVRGVDVKERKKEMEPLKGVKGLKEEVNEESSTRKEHEAKQDRRSH
ncbi:hypothetical protein BGAL_0366g00130 [Botrytis galanthina]|uniref:RPA43 OB domain-containing protein n=1 Tax=Botrytis galanthina TaxID=278940 RepID=A0A4V6T6V8_9HELO|nr:hypothetical protein BGAL_0366g00130 [Botrytis galanthina]